ncbi:MAG: caspase family protein [SAR324 cluster bacterium]|nr:caspase family protein [SAR324 cluster bacterium]
MRKQICQIIWLLCLWSFVTTVCQAASLHAIIVADTNDRSIGKSTKVDFKNISAELENIAHATNLQLKKQTFTASAVTRENLVNAISNLQPALEDVVLFYYSGHGYRAEDKKSKWPTLSVDEGLDYTWVIEELKKKNPRLLITLSDACNVVIQGLLSSSRSMAKPRKENYKKLFLDFNGQVLISSSQPGEFSWGGSRNGGLYTSSFLKSLREALQTKNPSWKTLLAKIPKTISIQDNQGRKWKQHPQYEVIEAFSLVSALSTPPTDTDGRFRVEIKTNKGKQNLAFHEDEEIEFFVKLSQPGYFYVAGHHKKSNTELSYLLDINNQDDEAIFIYQVDKNVADKWVSLGKFTVAPPFGLEAIQVVASNQKFDQLPPFQYDQKLGYHIIADNIEKGIDKIRQVKPINNQKTLATEAALIIETKQK